MIKLQQTKNQVWNKNVHNFNMWLGTQINPQTETMIYEQIYTDIKNPLSLMFLMNFSQIDKIKL